MQLYLKWAVFISAVAIVIRLILVALGMSVDPSFGWMQWVATIIGLGLLFLGVRERKMQDPGGFTFGTGWVATFMISMLTGVILAIWIFVDATFIEPEMIDAARKAQDVAMAAQKMTPDQIEQAKKFSSFFVSPSGFAIWTVVAYLFGGALLGLLLSPIVKAVGGNSGAEPQTPTVAGM